MDEAERALQAIQAEFERLQLDTAAAPFGGLVTSGGLPGLERLLSHLRRLPAGATWRDVFPDLPKHWLPGRPETWTSPYHPRGSYDYQELPTSPGIFVFQDVPSQDWDWVATLVAEARAAGWPIYGAGPPRSETPVPGHANVILERGTSEDVTWAVAEWLDTLPGISLGGVFRTGAEEYYAG